ncbi:hypothetical protein [Muricauda brasiliensis]|uniref:hypothetical protein n=1 Tax=Muricauda brasiliensis TaxID=2162892 RepID=UPI000D3C712F|nr:hypothetical protein [Muricauda brasiliensis]
MGVKFTGLRSGMKFKVIVCLFLGLVSHAFAQTKGSIVYVPPSDDFVSIELQEFKGLPRLGVMDNYGARNVNPRGGVRVGDRNSAQLEKSKMVADGRNAFSLLVSLKYVKPFMGDLDRQSLTTVKGNMSKTEANSAFLQRFLLSQVAPNLCLNDDCRNTGRGNNEFERLRNYKTFVDKFLEPLLKWSQQVFMNGEWLIYHVSTLNIGGNYDFDRGGYWVYHSLVLNDIFPMRQGVMKRVVFEPLSPYEQALVNKLENPKGAPFFLQMDAQTAEDFKKKGNNRLYLVKKIKLRPLDKELGDPTEPIEFGYSHETPDLEIYTDQGLTEHYRTLLMNDLTLKN